MDHPATRPNARPTGTAPLAALLVLALAGGAMGQVGAGGGGGGAGGGGGGARVVKLAGGVLDPARSAIRLGRDRVADNERLIVQFDSPLTDAQRRDLDAAGVRLLGYVGDGAYAARLRPGANALPHAKWIGRLDSGARKAPALNASPFVTAERREMARAGTAAVVVTLFEDASPEEVADTVRTIQNNPSAKVFGREVIGGCIAITASLNADAAKNLASLPAVRFVEDAPEIVERDTTQRWIVQSNAQDMTPLYAAGLTGVGQILGVADSRPDFNHCAFVDTVPPGPTHRKLLAYNSTTFNFASHGTHVSGIAVGDAGAFDDNRGVAYGAKFVHSPTPSFSEDGVMTVLNLHHSQGARVHTNSWGNDATKVYDSLARGVDSFMYSNEDDLVLFAVTNQADLRNPENCKNALAVGASQDFPSQDFFCSGGVGPTLDGRRKPEVFAPGCSIDSAQVLTPCSTIQFGGTSMATPAVAGVAVLLRQYFTEGFYPSGTANTADAIIPSGALMKAVIVNSATDMLSYGGTVPNNSEGWGRVLAHDAITFAADSRRLFVRDVRNAAGLSTGGQVEIPLAITSAAESLKITLAWTEPPASAGAGLPTINNLDLEVIAPDNTLFRGNVFAAGFSTSGGSADPINNLERVAVSAPLTGVWIIRIKGTAINQGLQGFGLAVNGAFTIPPRPLTIGVNAPLPSLITGNTHAQFGVTIDPGDDSLVPDSARVMWRKHPADAFTATPLFALGGTQYRATLPRFDCSDTPEFYVEATGASSGTITAPLGGGTPVALQIGTVSDTLILSEGFAGGLPQGWSATGLWHVTSSCPSPSPCDANQWAYFGSDSLCTYNVGLARQQGTLTMAPVALPSINPGESLTLRYCSFLGREQTPGFDTARVLVNGGTEIDQPTLNSAIWNTRTASLDAFAGTSPVIAFNFDTVDSFSNSFAGWKVDRIDVVHTVRGCFTPAPCVADLTGDGQVNTQDLTRFLGRFGTTGEPFITDGDLNGDGRVDTADLVKFLGAFATPC